MTNQEIAKIFETLAKLLEIKGENPFKVRAYKEAANTIANLDESLSNLVKDGYDLTKLPHIGEHISDKIKEIVNTGKLQKLEKLKREIPLSLMDLLSIKGLGAKRIKTLYEKLHITNLQELQDAAKEHKIRELKGFGEHIEDVILKGLKLYKQEGIRFLYADALPIANYLKAFLRKAPTIVNVEIAGSFRRKKETVGDLDIVASAKKPKEVIDYFVTYPKIEHIISKGKTRSTIVLDNNMQVDLRVVKPNFWGSTLHYFTGSKAHVIKIRKIALEMGLKVSEYGVFRGAKVIAQKSEEEVYKAFNMCLMPPEFREDRGEIEHSCNLPNLITIDDIKGDLHMHTTFSDGLNSIEEMVKKAIELGYEYIAISDHISSYGIVNGLDRDKIKKYFKQIDELNQKYPQIKIFKSAEVDILEDGTLQSNELLDAFDFVTASIHSKMNLSKEAQTKRLIKALKHKKVKILGHPTNRLIGKREPIEFDTKEVFKAAVNEGVALEINAQPTRLDLNDVLILEAKKMGAKFALNSDAHSIKQLDNIQFGINQARRGWLESDSVINCKDYLSF